MMSKKWSLSAVVVNKGLKLKLTSFNKDLFFSLVPEMSFISLFTFCTSSFRTFTSIRETFSSGLTSDSPEIG